MSADPDLLRPSPSTRRGLVGLGIATSGLLSSGVALVVVVGLVLSDVSYDIPYGGWQVDVTEGGLALGLGGVLVVSATALRRLWRALRGHTPYRRVPILIVLLPALFVGRASSAPLTDTVGWASDHTAAARAAMAAWEKQIAEFKASPTAHTHGTPAPAALGALLVHPSDLGIGWYDGVSPNPTSWTRPGALQAPNARTFLVRTHRQGGGWALAAPAAFESVRDLGVAAAAKACAAEFARSTFATRHLRVAGVDATERVVSRPQDNDEACFARGRYVFMLRIDPSSAEIWRTVLATAVRRSASA